MAQITFTIPDAKLPRIITAMKEYFPIPKDEDDNPLFTDNQWAKEAVRRWVRDQVARYEQTTARDAIVLSPEDDIIT